MALEVLHIVRFSRGDWLIIALAQEMIPKG
jgi:hypothetical protein